MLPRLIRRTTSTLVVALLAVAWIAPIAFAQQTVAGTTPGSSSTWPTTLTLGGGLGMNDNWNGSSGYDPHSGSPLFTQGVNHIGPEFHLLAEIPIGTNLMFAPRIAYNDYSLGFDSTSGVAHPGLRISEAALGADLLLKYSLSNFHVMGGFNLSTPVSAKYAYSTSYTGDSTLPSTAGLIAGLKLGVGYDIPLNSKNTIWLAPEAFFSYSFTKHSDISGSTTNNYYPLTITAGASLKFALDGAPEVAPPPPLQLTATITAHGVLPDGTVTSEPVSPQQAIRTRSSLPLLPYIFFDENSSTIPARYSRSGATGFSEQSALQGKDAFQANHEVLDVTGSRMKNDPSLKVKLVGTNSNSGSEKSNILLSKARARAVADYLISTWNIDPSRITIDQRNLPELPTNPLKRAGQEENRRVEIISTSSDLTAPVKIEKKTALSVGATQVRYDMTVSPDPSTHTYTNWTITLDKDGTPLGTPLSGTGAPPTSTTAEIPDAGKYLDQPIHYTLSVTDAAGRSARAEGLTRITAKTVGRDNLERYGMLSFDFDKAEINQRARQMLELISESISREATGLQIDGYCDSTGTVPYNQSLSEARANSAVTTLRSMTSLPSNVTVHGHGVRDPKFPNDLPEGRQLNRRVEFTIEKSSQ